MPIISNTQPAAIRNIETASTFTARGGVSAEAQLNAINAKYPNLEQALEKAQSDVESTKDSDTWAGLKWYEKAVFFIPPFGPLVGVMMLGSNKTMIRDAKSKLSALEGVAAQKSALESQIAASLPDRFVA